MDVKEAIIDLLCEGFTLQEIADAICDGDYLAKEDISQEIAEDVYNSVTEKTDNN